MIRELIIILLLVFIYLLIINQDINKETGGKGKNIQINASIYEIDRKYSDSTLSIQGYESIWKVGSQILIKYGLSEEQGRYDIKLYDRDMNLLNSHKYVKDYNPYNLQKIFWTIEDHIRLRINKLDGSKYETVVKDSMTIWKLREISGVEDLKFDDVDLIIGNESLKRYGIGDNDILDEYVPTDSSSFSRSCSSIGSI